MLSDFLWRKSFCQRIQDHGNIDPRSLDTGFATAHVCLHHNSLQELSVCVIGHCQTILLDPKREVIDHTTIERTLSRLSPVINLNFLVKLADENKVILCDRHALNWMHYVISNDVKLVEIVNQFLLVFPERRRQNLTKQSPLLMQYLREMNEASIAKWFDSRFLIRLAPLLAVRANLCWYAFSPPALLARTVSLDENKLDCLVQVGLDSTDEFVHITHRNTSIPQS